MVRLLPPSRSLLVALALVWAAACSPSTGADAGDESVESASPAEIALFSSLPIAAPEGASMADLLAEDAPSHWATGVLAGRGEWRAVDWLGAREDGFDGLAGADLLVMAQPRPLAPEENVALDDYVRGGGHVLLFADPVLTQDSRYGLGDRRRPMHTAVLSPILTRWGLELERDDTDRANGVMWNGVSLPLAEAGRFRVPDATGDGAGRCELVAEGRIATCAIGAGRLVAFADAALLEPDGTETAEIRAALLEMLIDSALDGQAGKSRE